MRVRGLVILGPESVLILSLGSFSGFVVLGLATDTGSANTGEDGPAAIAIRYFYTVMLGVSEGGDG